MFSPIRDHRIRLPGKSICCLLLLFVISFSGCGKSRDPASGSSVPIEDLPSLTVSVLDVGKADCILLESGGRAIMIDTAQEDNLDTVQNALISRGIEKLDYLILNHMDKDHIGGAAELIRSISIDEVIEPCQVETSETYFNYRDALSDCSITPAMLKKKRKIIWQGAEMELMPGKNLIYEDDNDYSIMVSLIHGERKFLFAGDAADMRLGEYMEEDHGTYDFLKVPHHGRYHGQTDAFFNEVHPGYGVITCSKKNPADEKVLEKLDELGTCVFQTRYGEVNAVSDGIRLVVTQKEKARF